MSVRRPMVVCRCGCGLPYDRSPADPLTVGLRDDCWTRLARAGLEGRSIAARRHLRAEPQRTPPLSRCPGCGSWLEVGRACETCVRLVRTNFAGST